MNKLKIGDVVCLKSDLSLLMTIDKISSYENYPNNTGVKCIWFSGTTLLSEIFHIDTLILYSK